MYSRYTNLKDDDVTVAPYDIRMNRLGLPTPEYPGQMGLLAKGNVGLGLVLFIQDKCDYCDFALQVLEELEIANCQMYTYDLTNLSDEKLRSIDRATVFSVQMTPTFVLFCDKRPVRDAILAGWRGDKTGGLADIKSNKVRIHSHFNQVIEDLEGACARPQKEPRGRNAGSGSDDDDYDAGGLDLEPEYSPFDDDRPLDNDDWERERQMTGSVYTHFWKKAATIPH